MSGAHMLTIVIPVANRRNLESTPVALRQQTARRFATVLVDNASTDGSIEVLRSGRPKNNSPNVRVTVLPKAHPSLCRTQPRPGRRGGRQGALLRFRRPDAPRTYRTRSERHRKAILRPTYSAGIQFTGISSGKRSIHRFSTPTTPIGTRSSTAATPHNDGAPHRHCEKRRNVEPAGKTMGRHRSLELAWWRRGGES